MRELSHICTIQMGYTARGRLDPAEHGNVLALQLRDIDSMGEISADTLTPIFIDPAPEKYFVSCGDVVFRSRGERTTAAVVHSFFSMPVLAILPLVILRPNPQRLSGAYLAWAINQESAQRHFDEKAQGTSLRMVSRSTLEDLMIAVPDLETQQKILETDALAEQERLLAEQLIVKRHTLIHRLLGECARQHTLTTGMERIPQ